ncbi:hypothetical protein Tco_1291561 [Tanacetum coccineum]
MVFSVASHKEEGSSSTPTPPIPIFDLPEKIVKTTRDLTFEKRAKLCYKTFLTILLKNYRLCIKGLRFHPDYPFLNIFHIHDLWRFPKEALCFFYYLFESFTIGITFNAKKLLSYVIKSQFKDVSPHSKHFKSGSFLPPKAVNDDGSAMYHSLYCFIHDWYKVNPSSRRCERKLQTLYADTRIGTSDDDDDARSLWSSDDDEHIDPFDDDPTHPDEPGFVIAARGNTQPSSWTPASIRVCGGDGG